MVAWSRGRVRMVAWSRGRVVALRLLVLRHGAEGAHVVETVGELDEHDAPLGTHGEEEVAL
eukprot:5020604-Prymnesium_polylepis.1